MKCQEKMWCRKMGETVNIITKEKTAGTAIQFLLVAMLLYVSVMFIKIVYKIIYQYKVLGQFDMDFASSLSWYLGGFESLLLIPLSAAFLLSATIDFSLAEKLKVKSATFWIASLIVLTNVISISNTRGIYTPAEGLLIFLIFYTFTYIFILYGLTRKNWLPMTLISIGMPFIFLTAIPGALILSDLTEYQYGIEYVKNQIWGALWLFGFALIGLIDVGVGFKRLRVEHSTFDILKVVIGGIVVSAVLTVLTVFLVVIITSWRYFI